MRDEAIDWDNLDAEPARRPVLQRVGVVVGVLLLLLALGLLVRSFLGKPDGHKKGVQQIALLKQPPPPPPKPPEKPPEPPKVKEEVKVPEPTPQPKPDEAKPADDKPPSDKPLGVDAEGTAGSDGFGLAANRGGRDLLSTGGGGRGAYYSGLLQRSFFEALSRNPKVRKEEFSVDVKVWLGDDGRVLRSKIVAGSVTGALDELIRTTLAEMPPPRDVPPADLRVLELRLSNRA